MIYGVDANVSSMQWDSRSIRKLNKSLCAMYRLTDIQKENITKLAVKSLIL